MAAQARCVTSLICFSAGAESIGGRVRNPFRIPRTAATTCGCRQTASFWLIGSGGSSSERLWNTPWAMWPTVSGLTAGSYLKLISYLFMVSTLRNIIALIITHPSFKIMGSRSAGTAGCDSNDTIGRTSDPPEIARFCENNSRGIGEAELF